MEPVLTGTVALARDNGPGVLWGASLVIGAAYAVRSARRSGLDPRAMYWAAVIAIGVGLLGSRLLGMVVYRSDGPLALREIIAGGHSYYGGLVFGTIAALVYLHLRGLPMWRYADAMTSACALGYCIGRVGCFLNGCDYGVLTRGFAVRYPPDTEAFASQLQRGLIASTDALSLPVLPIQLFHAALGFILFLSVRRRAGGPGHRLGVFLLGYGVGRFVLEFFRGDFIAIFGSFSLHQVISLVLIAAGTMLVLRARGRAPATIVAAEAP
jgi:phosphatidylglycerol:prolipoprotein diacylglycerol transferase